MQQHISVGFLLTPDNNSRMNKVYILYFFFLRNQILIHYIIENDLLLNLMFFVRSFKLTNITHHYDFL